MIVKTFLLSQCIYFMNVLKLPAEIGGRINELMANFVGGGIDYWPGIGGLKWRN
jgi:hypothetical protein